ncbi:uncharacterized protein LOC114796429 isoform X2 [Denticeps clupeoides]|nr:uncharacterized protein LOC114796429 isoform X2 [Denticeps clupeoides]
MKEDLRNLVISNPEVKQLRILLHGPVGAGKSSFINAIDSIFQGRMACASLAEAATAGTSFTKVFKTYKIRNKQYGSYLPFVISDIMGLQPCESEGAHQDDLIQALEGRLMDGYKFNPISPLSESDQGYKPNPSNSDKTHCLVSIIPASKISLMDNKIIEKMRKIREKASDMGIPQVVVLTMVDQACPEVNKNLKMIYRSKKIKEKMLECENRLGVPMNCILPVKNYHEEISLNEDVDCVVLRALSQIIHFANDYVYTFCSDKHESSQGCSEQDRIQNPDGDFDQEWRSIAWDLPGRNKLESQIRDFSLQNPDVSRLRILLHGPIGAGKSSFINSINTVFQGRVTTSALVASEFGVSFTKKYNVHKFRNGSSGFLPFIINDTMGLEKGKGQGVDIRDIISALTGHIKDNYKFNPVSPLTDEHSEYNKNPNLSDKVHCLVSILPADKISVMDDEVIAKMKTAREAASDMDIPQVVIMTRVDKGSPQVKENLRSIYFSKKIKAKIEECSIRLGVPMNCIFPVKNYHEEESLNLEMDCLILAALRQILHFANDYVDRLAE